MKAKPPMICSKGVETCFRSVVRVEKLTKQYLKETFRNDKKYKKAVQDLVDEDGPNDLAAILNRRGS